MLETGIFQIVNKRWHCDMEGKNVDQYTWYFCYRAHRFLEIVDCNWRLHTPKSFGDNSSES